MNDIGDGDNDDHNDDFGMGWVLALFWKSDYRPF